MLILLLARIALAACPDDAEACPRCLDVAPPGGVYAPGGDLPVCPDVPPRGASAPEGCVPSIVARPVAVVAGCVGTTAGDAWIHAVQVTPPDRFSATDSDGHRCPSGTTAEYVASAQGLTASTRLWTLCGGNLTREVPPMDLLRVEAIDASDGEGLIAAFEHADEAVRAAALEAIARRQPEEWTCEPLGRAVRGGLGTAAMARGVALSATACLVGDLRVALFDHRWSPASDRLAALEASDAAVADDLVRAVRDGVIGAPRALAERLARAGVVDPDVREALTDVLLDPNGTSETRQAAVEGLDRLFREASDGHAMIREGSRRGSCEGWQLLLGTLAVEASGDVPPRAVAKRCPVGEPRPFY